jgi:hypothetical protein
MLSAIVLEIPEDGSPVVQLSFIKYKSQCFLLREIRLLSIRIYCSIGPAIKGMEGSSDFKC